MRVTRIEIEGYRSIKGPLVWELAPLNVLIGPNAGGKSNLLRCLDLQRAAAAGGLSKAVLSEGGMGAIAWNGGEEEIALGVDVDAGPRPREENCFTKWLYRLRLARVGGTAIHAVSTESLNCEIWEYGGQRCGAGSSIERSLQTVAVLGGSQSPAPGLPEIDRSEALLGKVAWSYVDEMVLALQTDIAGWRIYQDIRSDREAASREAPVVRFDPRLEPDGSNLVTALHTLYTTSREFKELMDNSMFAAFGEEFEEIVFTPAASQRIELGIRWRSLRDVQPSASLSDGTLRFLALLTILNNPDPAPLIAIDEPETGLHPGMFAIVAEAATVAAEKSTVILTTHSPGFLDTFEDPPMLDFVLNTDGETRLLRPDPEKREYWLSKYNLGEWAFWLDPEELTP